MTGGAPEERRTARRRGGQGRAAGTARRLEPDRDRRALWHAAMPGYWLGFDTDTHVHHAKLVRKAETAKPGPAYRDPCRRRAGGDRAHHLCARPCRPVLADRRRHGALGGLDRRRQDRHPGQRHGARHLLDPGSPGHALRRSAGAQEPVGADREIHLRAGFTWPASWRPSAAPPCRAARGFSRCRRTSSSTTRPATSIRSSRSTAATASGLLYDLTATLTALGLQIASAHITTYGERVVDVFYVKDVFGLKVHSDSKLKDIESRLLAALTARPAGRRTRHRKPAPPPDRTGPRTRSRRRRKAAFSPPQKPARDAP